MPSEPEPSATVVVVRDSHDGLELLLLQRAKGKGAWVFPGGKVDPADRPADAVDLVARRAAVREAREEAALELDPGTLVPISRWVTPAISPRRFDTWFFLASVGPEVEVRVDGSEMQAHRWMAPAEAIAAHQKGHLGLAPPTFVTVTWLDGHRASTEALHAFRDREILTFHPRVCRRDEGACMLYPGDAGYEHSDPDRTGPRHRLWAIPGAWHYEHNLT